MAAVTQQQIFQNNNNNNNEVSRQEIQAAIAKAVELRALHAALMQGNSPVNTRYPSSSPVSQFSAQDYPVFTPSYEDETLSGYNQIPIKSRSESWDETVLSDYKENLSSKKGLMASVLSSFESHNCPVLEDQKSVAGSCTNHITVLQTSSPGTEFYKSSRRNSMGDLKSVSSSCNRCKPAVITTSESENVNVRNFSNLVVPLTDSHASIQSKNHHQHHRGGGGGVIAWLFPRLKKKHKTATATTENSPNRTESEEVSQSYKELGIVSIESLKRELIEANENRDAALVEVSEMKSSLGELRQKLEYLESYCEELKKALNLAATTTQQNRDSIAPKRGKSIETKALMPVTEEVMVEGFIQIVSEARLSVKQFCKTLVEQIEESDHTLTENLNSLLQPYKLSLTSKYSKAVLYHLEAIINQSLYQDFENPVFQKNGSPKILDPQQDRQAQFSSFVALRNLSWNEVLRKGTKYYSEEFSKFCDQKMSCIITSLNWTRPWPEQLLQAFFVAAKCIWLLHLLAFSFNPPLGILRVEENRNFDSVYMEDMFMDRQRSYGPSRVKVMVMPGFYVQDRVLKCKVVCRYKAVA